MNPFVGVDLKFGAAKSNPHKNTKNLFDKNLYVDSMWLLHCAHIALKNISKVWFRTCFVPAFRQVTRGLTLGRSRNMEPNLT